MTNEKNSRFFFEIGKDLGILPSKQETEDHYLERVILSAGAKWMLTAVYNETEKVSIENVKKTAREKIESYLKIIDHPSIHDVQTIANYLYDVLLANGMFYHEQYYARPVRNREIGIDGVSFIRGLLPEENARFSGMSPYIPGGGKKELAKEFMLWKSNGEETIRNAWLRSSPQDEHTVIGEYLRTNREGKQLYYDTHRHDHAEITMGRTRKSDISGFEHYIINGNEIRRFTDDYVGASVHEYVRLAIVNSQMKQKVLAKIDKDLVNIHIGYLLPKPDMRFLRFVSWPDQLQDLRESQFQVSLHPRIWPVVKERLIFLGFAVEEQHE